MISRDWLRQKIEIEPHEQCEAGAPLCCTCSSLCWPEGIDPEKQKHHDNCDLIDDWRRRYIAEFMRRTNWTENQSYMHCQGTLENLYYDLEDMGDPVEAVAEDLSCWSD